eukprot:1994151-Pyramimonas_sp.AAC.1
MVRRLDIFLFKPNKARPTTARAQTTHLGRSAEQSGSRWVVRGGVGPLRVCFGRAPALNIHMTALNS